MQGRLLPGHEGEYERCLQMGIADPHKLLTLRDLVGSENCIFAATGITTGLLLAGITRDAAHAEITHSLITCGGTSGIHYIRSVHESPVRI